MSLALIQESAKEVRRLAIAGSTLAVGDFRLKKLVAPLEQVGAKVPVFAQVAKAINDLVNGKEAESAAKLLSLSTLLNAILYTQGQTGTQAEITELPMCTAKSGTTRTSARVLKPLIEALTSSGGGRFELVKAAIDRGAFQDLRLIAPSIQALDDNYPELAELIGEKVLPAYGPGIAPFLKEKINLKGKKSDGRRLKILHQLDPAGNLELCKKALDEGSAEVKVAAIACLGQHEECLPLVIEESNSKNKILRNAALRALAAYDRADVTKTFMDLIQGRSLDVLIESLQVTRNRQVLNALLAEGKRVFELLLKGEAEQIQRFSQILECLNYRKDAEVEEFLLTCFSQCDKLAKLKAPKNSHVSGADLVESMAELLYNIGSPKAYEAVLAKRDVLPTTAFDHALDCALRHWPPAKVFDEFVPLLEQTKGPGKDKKQTLEVAMKVNAYGRIREYDDEPDRRDKFEWDPRWLDAAIKFSDEETVCALARPGHKAVINYLLKALESKKQIFHGHVIDALERCRYPKLTELFLDLITKKTKSKATLAWDMHLLLKCIRFLPPSDLPKLEQFVSTLDEKFIDDFVQALEPLRAAKASGSASTSTS